MNENLDAVVNARILDLEAKFDEIRAQLDFIKETIVKADTTITTVAEQVMPSINELMASPMLKMLGVGKKK